jgi:hypothetical protein
MVQSIVYTCIDHDAVSDFIVARILFGPVGVSSPAADSSSLCAAEADFRLVDNFFRAVADVGEGEGSSNVVLSGIIFYKGSEITRERVRTLRCVRLLRLNMR